MRLMSCRLVRPLLTALLLATPVILAAQFTTPHTIATAGAVTSNVGSMIVINQGLVGVGRVSASMLDSFGESFGSVSSLQVTDWSAHADGTYTGVFNILPDRGYNSGNFFSDYAARINQVTFRFTPYTGAANIGGTTDLEKLAAQNQIVFTSGISGVKFSYADPNHPGLTVTTGLDPATSFTTLFGKTVPYVTSYTGLQSPSAASNTTYPGINKLPLDSEALIIKPDGSGYIGDEYGANIYYFNSSKQIIGVIVPPPAFQPNSPVGTPFFSSSSNPVDGRRPNQGFEGVGLSPDGTHLFALLQSATIQDSDANNQNRLQTRLLVYDVSVSPVPATPIAEYALTLPTYRGNGNGGAVNNTAQQSELIALDNSRFLYLPRDGNGLGNSSNNPSMIKSVFLADIGADSPTEFSAVPLRNKEGGKITSAPGVLDGIVPLTTGEVVNMLNTTQLAKFNIALDTGGGQVSKLTLGEKWEGMALVPANDPTHPNDYFLFIGNDNDFLTSAGHIKGPDGTIVGYNGFAGYPANRIPPPLDSANNENDTMILAFRLTIVPGTLADTTPPAIVAHVSGTSGTNGWYTSNVTVTWDVQDPQSGIASKIGCGDTTITAETAGTTLTCQATNGAGLGNSVSVTIKVDKTAPVFTGLPAACSLWPPNKKMVQVGTIAATDALSGLVAGSFNVSGTSNEPQDPSNPDIAVAPAKTGGFSVSLRAERLGGGNGRVYTVTAVATDQAGNSALDTATCVVPHDQGSH
jgi:hypothetical protein